MFTHVFAPPWPVLLRDTGAPVTESLANPDGSIVAEAGAGIADSVHHYAGVFGSVEVPPGHTTLVAAAPLSINWWATVWAYAGYSSSEALVTLTIRAAGQVIEDRWSLAHPIAPVFGDWGSGDQTTSIPLRASMSITSSTEPTTVEVGVTVEAWAGAGGFAGSGAKSSTIVTAITLTATP